MKKHVLAAISFVIIFSVIFCNVFVTHAADLTGDINSDGKVKQSCASLSNSSGDNMPSTTITSARPGTTVYVVVQTNKDGWIKHFTPTAISSDVALTPKSASWKYYTYSWMFTMPEKNVTIKASGK